MKKTKKLSIIAAASAIALGVSTFGTAANAADYKITFIQGVAGDAFYVTMGCGVAAAAAKDGATITTPGGEFQGGEDIMGTRAIMRNAGPPTMMLDTLITLVEVLRRRFP